MTLCTTLWVNRSDYRQTQRVDETLSVIQDGEVLVAIDKFGLTANNVSYAVSGDMIGYWGYYPTGDSTWGIVPVWGCASVVESRSESIPVGDRLWGFFPMASHAVLQPGKVMEDQFIDMAEHRSQLPALYNAYRRTAAEPEILQQMENERCLLFPLFATSFILYDYLIDNNFFGAQQVLIGSVSSKTGFGLAQMLSNDASVEAEVVGFTSAANVEFVEGLGCCDTIVTYGDETSIDASKPAAYVDMSGDVRLKTALHNHMGENMVESAMVGASHWEDRGNAGDLPGAKPRLFFAPGQIAKRDEQWGPGVALAKAMQASAEVAMGVRDTLDVVWVNGADDLVTTWNELLDNKIPPSRGLMVSLL